MYLCTVLYKQSFQMKKNLKQLYILVVLAASMTSCMGLNDEPTFVEADLLGLWAEGSANYNDTIPVHFVHFTKEQDPTGEYKYGRQWNEREDIYEEDLVPYGNGWFKYKLVKSDLTEIHLMDNGDAEVPKVYVVTKLTDTELQYKDNVGTTHSFDKVVEKE